MRVLEKNKAGKANKRMRILKPYLELYESKISWPKNQFTHICFASPWESLL